jgi:Regulator of ribonuclease activity B
VTVIDALLENARADADLFQKNDARGDVFAKPRDVEFLLIALNPEKAGPLAKFINDNRYGRANVQDHDGAEVGVLVTINMPVEQNILHSVSALMVCLGAMFGATYSGWGCVLQSAP